VTEPYVHEPVKRRAAFGLGLDPLLNSVYESLSFETPSRNPAAVTYDWVDKLRRSWFKIIQSSFMHKTFVATGIELDPLW